MSKDHDFSTGFTDIYRGFPCLCKKTDPHYHNTVKRKHKILSEKYNEYDPNVTKQSVLQKINSLHSAYNKEHKKITESERSCVETDDIYSPLLCYYGFFISFSKFT
jgi:hypothetical protein